jgi:hypothetical protein
MTEQNNCYKKAEEIGKCL